MRTTGRSVDVVYYYITETNGSLGSGLRHTIGSNAAYKITNEQQQTSVLAVGFRKAETGRGVTRFDVGYGNDRKVWHKRCQLHTLCCFGLKTPARAKCLIKYYIWYV